MVSLFLWAGSDTWSCSLRSWLGEAVVSFSSVCVCACSPVQAHMHANVHTCEWGQRRMSTIFFDFHLIWRQDLWLNLELTSMARLTSQTDQWISSWFPKGWDYRLATGSPCIYMGSGDLYGSHVHTWVTSALPIEPSPQPSAFLSWERK